MRDRSLPTDESSFYQRLRDETLSSIFWERLELKTDSGFPDSHFVLRPRFTIERSPKDGLIREGTCEFKYQRTGAYEPNLRALMEATQQANFLEYFAAGGRRRFLLCCNAKGTVHFYRTVDVVEILRKVRIVSYVTMQVERLGINLAYYLE